MRAKALAGLVLALVAAHAGLVAASHDVRQSFDGALWVVILTFCAAGFTVARRQPANPLGWLLLWASALYALDGVSGGYAVLDYRRHRGALPFGHAAIVGQPAWALGMVLLGFAVALFPGDRPPSPAWRRLLVGYGVLGGFFYGSYILGQALVHVAHDAPIDGVGNYVGPEHGLGNVFVTAAWLSAPAVVAFWAVFVLRLARAWRHSGGDFREQLKWLGSGGAVSVVAVVVVVFTNGTPSDRAITDVAALGIAAFPLGLGVAILRYRLYDIDRLISRTISYLVLTGILVAVFAGMVVLVTDVLPFSSPVGVAASTLAAAALFNPLRRRLQLAVDRRFNRSRYDAEATVAAFSQRLREAVALESVEAGLLETVGSAVQPSHVTVWLRSTA